MNSPESKPQGSEQPTIEPGIAIPERSRWTALLRRMSVGDSIVVTINEATAVRAQAKFNRMAVVSRTVSPNQVRVWRTK